MATRRRRPASPLDHLGPDTCVIYLRISQDRTGQMLGVDRQLPECRDLAARLGLRVVHVYTDNDISATNGKSRPEFEAMLAAHPEVIISWHQDRLLRLTSDLERVIDLGVDVHFVTSSKGGLDLSTPAGRAVARTVAAWSQYEGEQKAERQYAANRQRAEAGHWQFSRRPFGYDRIDGQIVPVPHEADIVRECYRRYNAGESLYAIANDLNARGVPTHDTNAAEGERTVWSMRRVQQLLRNEHYAGIVTYLGERIDAEPTWEPLIDSRTWSDYLAMRDGRTREGAWSTATKHLLSGLLVCGVCGGRMLARPDRGKQVYACTANWCVSIQAADVEPVVNGIVLARLGDKRVLKDLRAEPNTAPVVAELDTLRERHRALIGLVADGALPRAEARQRGLALADKIETLEKRLTAMRRESPLTDLALARSIPTRWRRMPLLEKRRVIEDLGLVVTIGKTRPGRRPRDADGKPIPDLDRMAFAWRDTPAEPAEAS
ncbi:recombinase family protein [Zhihengliuella sp. ISTPL4]|uniref:recombinase family protein n=1 Tax=Zhihengliuella sp. ISTPL4 TaxID=2058657 RepID=UPI001305360B|nr:recombinase family protein [Zhihengliuella sp. ISTPL4]